MTDSRQLSAIERINYLLDNNSFVEIGAMVTKRNTDFNMMQKSAPSDGVITGYGSINDSPVYIYSQDINVLNGTMGEMHAKKIIAIYDLAIKTGVPVIALIDCGGLRLSEATDALNAYGELYRKQVDASGVIPQISAILGTCGGASAISASLSDFVLISDKSGKMFVNAPNTLTNNHISKCDTSSAKFLAMHGITDFVCDDDTTTLDKIREILSIIPFNNEDKNYYNECSDSLNRLCENLSADITDSTFILREISDRGLFVETKKDYAKELVTGFIKLNGRTIGCVANRNEIIDPDGKVAGLYDYTLTSDGCQKAVKFIKYCNSFNIPILSLTNVTHFEATIENEISLAKSAAMLTASFIEADVPKINLITDKAFGSAYLVMNSKHIGADLVFAWENSMVGTVDAKNAVQIIYADEISDSDNKQVFIEEKTKEYESLQLNANLAAKRGYIDCIINPEMTRKNLIYGFEMLATKK